ncbi:hypothetical protein BDN72DRAFT_247154 [Pluteus cervinus]|uniref:Uncharacterized protein n=1 Tax=Pluteus cervinus TaxID=181527 RepID=A0ACD3B570_9AGAR|nr:hypothetical protein BDN72DRAFT_247154 [Pluteus cervinus]
MSLPSDELPLAVTSGSASETSNAVSRALQIVDIVQEILEWLCPPLLTLSDYLAFIPTRKIFLHTALSCHTFLEPSLNILWRSMHSIFPLLKLLPTECFHERNGEYVSTNLSCGDTCP